MVSKDIEYHQTQRVTAGQLKNTKEKKEIERAHVTLHSNLAS
jgi:hypothetical protein